MYRLERSLPVSTQHLSHKIFMQFIVKHPKQCTRNELDGFIWLLSKLSLLPSSYSIKKISSVYLLGFCKDDAKIIWISAIKKPKSTRIQELRHSTATELPDVIWEYGYVYVSPSYRWSWISKKLYALLVKKIGIPLYATVKADNLAMKKLLKQFGFTQQGQSFKSAIDGKSLIIYTKNR